MLIITAAVFLFGHAALTAFFTVAAIKFHARFFPHAVMYLHGNAR